MTEMTVIVGSGSSRKIAVVEKVFRQYFSAISLNIYGKDIPSGQPDTPYDRQTIDGAVSRASGALIAGADYGVGLESGLVERYGYLFEEAWACVVGADQQQVLGYSSGLLVPQYIQDRMKDSGRQHSDEMTHLEEELHLPGSDTWSNYSGGLILREVSLEEALRNALLQLVPHGKSLYKSSI